MISHPDHTLDTTESNCVLSELTKLCLDRLSEAGWTAAGQVIADCIASGDFPALCHYDPDVLDLSAHDQYWIYQSLAFWRKRDDIDLGIDRADVAREKFIAAEKSCRRVNAKFAHWKAGRFTFSRLTERILHAAQIKVQSAITAPDGGCDAPTFEQLRPRFGPGATTSTPKKNANPLMKISGKLACSDNMLLCSTNSSGHELPGFPEALSTLNLWGPEEEKAVSVEIHRARLSFVPKNAKTDRAICTEPLLNGMYQLGLGDLLAERLRANVRIDIKDQTPNQRAALYGSISGGLATIDLSSASDTIAINLVEHLFPPDWFDLFLSLRTNEVEDGDEIYSLQKISSMGNGFTFPLETIIFWAISAAVVDACSTYHSRRCIAYGDDIIVPSDCAESLSAVLDELGFTVNPSKSFWSGSFRESCGKDYVLGLDVRPVFVDGPLSRLSTMTLHNYFARKKEWALCRVLESILHPSVRLRGPDGYGDGHLISDVWVSKPEHRKGWSGYTFETFRASPKDLRKELVKKFARPVKIPAWRWIPGTGWAQHGTKRTWEYNPGSEWHIRRLATYLSYSREGADVVADPDRPFRHSIADPDTPAFSPFRVPGERKTERLKIYIFEPPRLH